MTAPTTPALKRTPALAALLMRLDRETTDRLDAITALEAELEALRDRITALEKQVAP